MTRREKSFEVTRRGLAESDAKWCATLLHHDNDLARKEVLKTNLAEISGFDEELLREAHLEVRNTGQSFLGRMAQTSAMLPTKDIAPFGSRKTLAISTSTPALQTADAKVPFGSRKSVT